MLSVSATAQPVPRIEVDVRALASENPLLLAGGDTDAGLVEVTARPGVELTMPEGTSFDLSAVVTGRRYTRRYGGYVIGRADAVAGHRASEFVTYRANAGYSRDLAVDLLTTSIDGGIDPLSVRSGLFGGAGVTWRPNEYTSIIPAFSFEQFRYDRSSLIGDTRSLNGSVSLGRRTGPLTTIGVRAGGSLNRIERAGDIDTAFLYATIDRRLGGSWRLSGEIGAERVGARVETLLGAPIAQPARTRLSGRAELCRDTTGSVICASGALNTEVSGIGGLQRRAVFAATMDQRLGERTTASLNAEYQRTMMQGGILPDLDAIRAVGVVERRVRRDLTLGATLQYLRRRLIDGTRIGAAFAGVQITWAPQTR